jgi:hypothetical protein
MPVKRFFALTVGLCPLVLCAIVAILWVLDHTPQWVWWKTGLVCLIVAELGYVLTFALAIPGALVLGFLTASRRGRPARSAVGRWCLLCVSFTCGIIATDIACTFWRHRSFPSTTLPTARVSSNAVNEAAPPPFDFPPDEELPLEFPDPKQKGEISLVVLGESSAQGVPFDYWVSIGEIVRWQLNELLPDRRASLLTLADAYNTLETQHRRLSKLRRRPDAVIIYCGHNEFSARCAPGREPGHYFDEALPSVWSFLVTWIEQVSAVCGLISETADKCRVAIPPPRFGRRALVDVPAYTPREYTTLVNDFRRRLDAMVAYVERVGAIPILIVPPANDADYEPNRSFLPARVPHRLRQEFARDFLAARRREAGDPAASLQSYQMLLAREPNFAETHYRIARLLEREQRFDLAYQHYVRARDLDGFPMRLPSEFQDAYHATAARHGSILIDGQSYFHTIGQNGLLGDELFQDAMHPSLRGQVALAQAILQAMHARRAFNWPEGVAAPVLDPADCIDHFNLGSAVWKKICLWGVMFYQRTAPLRYDPSHRRELAKAYGAAFDRIEAGAAPESAGLPNVGTPRPVPAISVSAGGPRRRMDRPTPREKDDE